MVDREFLQVFMAEAAPQGSATATKVVEAFASAKSEKRLVPWRRPGERKGLSPKNKGKGKGKKNSKDSAKNKKSLQGPDGPVI